MPKIFEYFGFIFLFYSNEHEPIHVHVMKEGHEAIFEIMLENGELAEVRRRTSNKIPPLSEKDAATAEAFVKKYYKNIVDKWVNFFIYKSYLNENKFKKFKIEFGNIVWGKNWDLIFPIDKLYAGVCC